MDLEKLGEGMTKAGTTLTGCSCLFVILLGLGGCTLALLLG